MVDAEAAARACFDDAEAAELAGRPWDALTLYQRALHLDPHDGVAATNLAVVAKHLGKAQSCRAALLMAQAVEPSRQFTHAQRLLDGGHTFGVGGDDETMQ
eukprot:2703407-Prymnesium_polylepis.1